MHFGGFLSSGFIIILNIPFTISFQTPYLIKVFICVFDLWRSYITLSVHSSFLPWLSTVGFDRSALSFSFCFHWSPVQNVTQSSALLLPQQVHLPSASHIIPTLMSHQSWLASLISPVLQAISLLYLLLKHTILMSKSASWKLNFLSFLPILTSLPLLLKIPLSFSIL